MTTPTLELLRQLVRIPSVNPAFPNAEARYTGEQRIADFLCGELSALGFDVRLDEVAPGRPNLVADRPGRGELPVAFCAHTDTVDVHGMSIDPFAGEFRNGIVYGRGAADTKAAIAAAVGAVRSLIEQGVPLPAVRFILTCGEEAGLLGARHYVATDSRPVRGVVIGEPTGGLLRIAHKGTFRCRISTRGRCAHSSVPREGVNAVYRMGRLLARLEDYATQLERRTPDPVLGAPTFCVALIRGGSGINSVPDRCEIQVDRRTLPGETDAAIRAEIAQALGGLEGVEMGETIADVPALPADWNDPWVRLVVSALGRPDNAALPYTTDASVLAPAGHPCVILGPGEIERAHSAEEQVSGDQVHRVQTAYEALLDYAAQAESSPTDPGGDS